MKYLQFESYRAGLLLSTLLDLVAKGSAFGVNVVVAAVFGVGAQTDLCNVILGTAMSLMLFIVSLGGTQLSRWIS